MLSQIKKKTPQFGNPVQKKTDLTYFLKTGGLSETKKEIAEEPKVSSCAESKFVDYFSCHINSWIKSHKNGVTMGSI